MPPARAECQYCAQTFSKRCHLYRHWRMNRCAILRQQHSHVPPAPQLPSQLSSMSQQQQIAWLTEFLSKNDEKVTQNLMQSAWAMISATALSIPAVEVELRNQPQRQLQVSSKQPPNGQPRPDRKEGKKEKNEGKNSEGSNQI